ncbi:MAG TPA: asparagine synthase-related protein [Steroidobacteraceae bacterium]
MYAFVALLWAPDDPGATATATQWAHRLARASKGWESLLTTKGIIVLAQPPTDPGLHPYVLPEKAGIVLGQLFSANLSRPSLAPIDQIDARAAQDIARTGGQHLVRNYWGAYIAVLADPQRQCAYVIRDCSGKLPCYYRRHQDVTIVFSDTNDLSPLELPATTPNWNYLAAFIYSSQLQVRDCATLEEHELLVGERLTVRSRANCQTAIWDPRQVCREQYLDRYEDAVAALREVAEKCIEAWARIYDNLLLGLSGGFDSAVVLGVLSRSPTRPTIQCINHYSTDAYEDERKYARASAARAGVPLVEIPIDSAAERFDSRLLLAPRTPKPSVITLFRFLEIGLINGIAQQTGARTLWTGQGGDHIFLQTTGASSAADYLDLRGLRPGFVAAVRDAAHLSRQPYWSVLRSACFPRRSNGAAPASKPCFVTPTALPDNVDSYVLPPWTTDATDLPRGKLMQIRFLAEVANRHRPIARLERAPQHHPLLSQPLMEVCLQIPTYLLLRGGRERALARDAFAHQIPSEILRRYDKGSTIGHATEMLRRSEPFLGELLLGGVLAANKVIDPRQLESFILRGQPFREEHLLPLLACIAAEIHVRKHLH